MACAHDGRGCAGVRMAGGGAALSRVSSRGRLAAPYPTVPYSTVPYCVLPYSRNIRQSISYPVSLKESQGERKPLWETGENVENSVESVWKTCFKALRPLRAGAAGSLMDTFGRTWSGGAQRWTGAAREGVDAVGQTPVLAAAGRDGAWGRADRGDVRVRQGLSAGCGLARAFGRCGCDAFGWRVVAAVRCGTRVQRRARWLAFFPREKMLDKLCKSILNWKQGITQAAARDGLRHRPHRRSCSAHPTSTSSVAATSVMRCAFDARLSGAALRKTETKNSAPHRTEAGRSFVTAAAQARLPFRWLSCAAAFSQPFLCACGHRAAFLTRPSRSCPRATPRTGCAYGRSGGRTPSSPATTAGRTR